MTVQEAKAKEVLNNIWDFADAQDEEKGDVVDDAIIEAIGCMEEVEQYRAFGTVEELKEAREKQVAKKPKYKTTCERCGTHNSVWGKLANPKGHSVVYCWNCGQANELDWSREDD